jgi:hypothetical protein
MRRLLTLPVLGALCLAQAAWAEPPARGAPPRQVRERPPPRPELSPRHSAPEPWRDAVGHEARTDTETRTDALARPLTPEERAGLHRDLGEAYPGIDERRREIRRQASERFRHADIDSDGALTRGEMQSFNPRAARAFQQMDRDRDGAVTEQEMANFIRQRRAVDMPDAPLEDGP